MHPGHNPSRRRRRRQPKPKSMKDLSIVGALLLIAALQSRAAAFLAPTPTRSSPRLFSPTSRRLLRHNNGASGDGKAIRPRTALSMVTRTGGRLIVSTEQFETEVLSRGSDADAKSPPILVLFTAPWCGPCRLTTPVVKDVMKQYQGRLEVCEISTDDLPEVASEAGVLSIPTILIYHGGRVRETIVGCVAKNVLARAVDKVLEDLGMDGGEGGE